jgi:hypothetical protein
MLLLLRDVTKLSATRAWRSWPVALALVVYAVAAAIAGILVMPLGMIGGIIMSFVIAACWSSYLELIAQAVAGNQIRIRWDDFKRTFGARLWDVVSVMFAFWIISFLTAPLAAGDNGAAVSGVLAVAIAFFFNAVPELLYQGRSRSFALLLDSARFMLANPLIWLLPNLVFAAIALGAAGLLSVQHPGELLVVFGAFFSSPFGALMVFKGIPPWGWPLALAGVHFVMVFRGTLFAALVSGGGNARLRAFQAAQRRD